MKQNAVCEDIPQPVVRLNRWVLVLTIVTGLGLGQPLVTTALLILLLPTVLWGQRYSLVRAVGVWLYADTLHQEEQEDRRLMRFNNTIACLLLGGAQVAFLAGATAVGWALAAAVAVAAGVALAGFCVGCFLYFQFKLNRFRLFGR